MDLEQVFYALAALFGLAAIIYFAWEYIEVLPRITKSLMLFSLSIIFFLLAGVLADRESSQQTKKVKA